MPSRAAAWSMLLPEKILVLAAGQNELHTCAGSAPLARWISRGASSAPDDERYAAEYLLAHERLEAAGYHFYEVSNAARDGLRSRHNSAYWSRRPYVGLGPAARARRYASHAAVFQRRARPSNECAAGPIPT